MTPERFRESLPAILCTTLGIILALYCGRLIGSGSTRSLLMLLGGFGFLAVGILFRSKIWLLIPLTAMASGSIPSLPLPFSVANLGIITAFVWFLILRAVRFIDQKPEYSKLDFLLFANVAYLVVTFLRNPVGVQALGSDLVGGRPYFHVFLALCAYFVIQRASLSISLARKIPWLYILSSSLTTIAGAITFFFPSTVPIFSRLYSDIVISEYLREGDLTVSDENALSRYSFLTSFGSHLGLLLASFYRPLTLVTPFHLWRFLGFGIGITAILLSGYRNSLIFLGGCFLLAIYYQRRIGDLLKILFYVVPFVAVILFLQGRAIELPFAVQRTLSFLPGIPWSEQAKQDAQHSVEWRIHLWKSVWENRKYWKDHWWGDGFGYSADEQRVMAASSDLSPVDSSQENFLITGDLHSGPLTAARTVGYVGTALFLAFYIGAGIYAHRLIRRAEGTPFFAVAMFFGIPVIYGPFHFIFIFGSFKHDMSSLILKVTYLKLIARSLKDYLAAKAAEKANSDVSTGPALDHRPPLPSLLPGRPAVPSLVNRQQA